MKHRGEAHEFALYRAGIDYQKYSQGCNIEIDDPEFVHRISRVLRLEVKDRLILFNEEYHFFVLITAISKHAIAMDIFDVVKNRVFVPTITLFLPLLKREALEQAVYSAVELGVNHIQLLKTEKVQRQWQGKESSRLKHIMIAAAEQSKSFALPSLADPIDLNEVLFTSKSILFDVNGMRCCEFMKELVGDQHSTSYSLLFGPEGDLTEAEKFYVQQQGVSFVRLTPTVLRAQQAIALGIGLLRSFC